MRSPETVDICYSGNQRAAVKSAREEPYSCRQSRETASYSFRQQKPRRLRKRDRSFEPVISMNVTEEQKTITYKHQDAVCIVSLSSSDTFIVLVNFLCVC
jgi:hypothetical protein